MLKLFLTSRKWLTGLFLVNLAGLVFGLYYYSYQLSITPAWLWVFVIDCPLYVFLFAVICFRHLQKRPWPGWLYYLTSAGLIKYGLWTGLVIWLYSDYFFTSAPFIYAVLFPLHIGMILQGLVLIPWMKNKPWYLGLGLIWFLLNDWLDYFQGTLPLIPETYVQALMFESFAVTFLLILVLYFVRIK